jgi:mRNA-degrading endonuclease toxin of MazEF toxin-antitoxin module
MPASPGAPGSGRNKIRRGDIYWVDVSPTVGSEQSEYRPWVVLSVDAINSHLPIVIAVPLTGRLLKAERCRTFRILIPDAEKVQDPKHNKGCKGDSLALTEQIRVLSIERVPPQRAAYLTPRALASVEAGVAFVLGIR